MEFIEFLQQLQGIFDNTGDPTDYGCTKEELPAFKRRARNRYPGKPICVVADWKWLDARIFDEVNPDEVQEVDVQYLCARTILEDERNRPFNSVMTTALNEFSEGCIFCTRNTAYILVGSGKRKLVGSDAIDFVFTRKLVFVLPSVHKKH